MTVSVLRLFLSVPLVGLWCVIVVFSDHTHLLFLSVMTCLKHFHEILIESDLERKSLHYRNISTSLYP